MEKNKYLFIGALVLITGLQAVAQINRYVVFFSDKDNVSHTLAAPEAFLSERALARRQKAGVAVTEADLPVDGAYVQAINSLGADVFFTSRWFNAALVQMDASRVQDISGQAFVDSVRMVAPGAKLSHTQVDMEIPENFLDPDNVSGSTRTQLKLLKADKMHEDGYQGEGMLIAVMDDGFRGINTYKPFEHLFSENRLTATKDFVKNSGNVFQYDAHGSAVLSCLAASYGDDIKGMAPEAHYILCVTEDITSEYRIEEYNWLLAAEYADSAGVDVINTSLGYTTFNHESMDYTYAQMDGNTTVVARAAGMAADRGIILVASAGNEGSSSWKYITSPGDVVNTLAVGGVTSLGQRVASSSVGPSADGRIKPDVMAMGSQVAIFWATTESGYYTTGGGTSYASPLIAGLAAGVWQANPDWSPQQVMDAIRYSSSNSLNPDTLKGYGIPNYTLAVNGATLYAADILEDKITVYPNPFRENQVHIDFGGISLKHKLQISISDMRGSEIYTGEIEPADLPERLSIDINASGSGVYLLQLRSRKFKKTVKLIKI